MNVSIMINFYCLELHQGLLKHKSSLSRLWLIVAVAEVSLVVKV